MKRSLLTAAVVVCMVCLVSTASAGQKKHSGNYQKVSQALSQNLGLNLPSVPYANVASNFKKHGHKHQDQPKPLDPGRGDDRVPVAPTAPGYVFVNGHWERERAPKSPTMIVDPLPGSVGPVVRDHGTLTPSAPGFVFVDGHWERARATKTPTKIVDPLPGSGGPIVRDHRTTITPIVRDHRTTTGPIVRDHRSDSSQGGVTVYPTGTKPAGSTWQPMPWQPSGAAQAGPIVRDHRTTITPIVRDHRTTSGPIVRDHRGEASQGLNGLTDKPLSEQTRSYNGIPNPLDAVEGALKKLGSLF